MNANIKNIRSAYNSTRRFANSSSNSGIVEFTNAVRQIAYDNWDELPTNHDDLYKFIQKKMTEKGWNGYEFTTK